MNNSSLESKIQELQERLKKETSLFNNDNGKLEGPSNFSRSREGSGRRPDSLGMTPTRTRKQFAIPGSNFTQPAAVDPTEIDNKMKEIMERSGVIWVNGQMYKSQIQDLEPLGELGSGTCGHVVKMLHRPSNCVMAVKQMRWSGDLEENKRIAMDLYVVLKSHDCNYIVNCYGVFINEADVWICMELMSTCFDKLLKKLSAPIPEDILGKVALATVKALHYLKERHDVIHRDIKPSNILIDSQGNVKLCDFGISGHLVNSKAKSGNPGCAAYMSPERISPANPNSPDYDIRADVWSLGISLVELATGQFPYTDCQTDFEVLTKVITGDPPSLPSSGNFTPEFHEFINSCLCKDYHQRPKYKKLLGYPFLQRYERKQVDVAAWFATATQSARLTPNPVRKRSLLFWEKKKADSCGRVEVAPVGGEQGRSRESAEGGRSVWSSILKSPFFTRRKKSAEGGGGPPGAGQPPLGGAATPQPPPPEPRSPPPPLLPPTPPGNTSPIVLQRFLHQQIQHMNNLRKVHRSLSTSPPPLPRFGGGGGGVDLVEKELLADLKRLGLEDTGVANNNSSSSGVAGSGTTGVGLRAPGGSNPPTCSPSPEPPPRLNKMVSPLLLRRIAYNNMPEAEVPSFASLAPPSSIYRYGIPPQPPPRRKSAFESRSVPCSPIPHHRYLHHRPSPPSGWLQSADIAYRS